MASSTMIVTVRSATADDQAVIVRMVRGARLNPRDLRWERFVVAEQEGRVVGVRQVKVHRLGTREVASGVVLPHHRRRGISRQLMETILARESGPLYLLCDRKWQSYYEQFGFRRALPRELPSDFSRQYHIGRAVTTVLGPVVRRRIRIVPMRRQGA